MTRSIAAVPSPHLLKSKILLQRKSYYYSTDKNFANQNSVFFGRILVQTLKVFSIKWGVTSTAGHLGAGLSEDNRV